MEFEQILKKYRYIVDRELHKFFNKKIKSNNDQFLKKSYGYLKEFVLRPGKRIRPIATIMAYKSIKDNNEKNIYPVCIAPELYHSSSLIHDDIMDEDLLRRNKPTMHKLYERYFNENFKSKKYKGILFDSASKRFSVSMAIIQGNILYSLANSSILESKLNEEIKNNSLKICNEAYRKTNEGQIFDVLMSSKDKLFEIDYINMVLSKTAFPIFASMQFGAILNNANSTQLNYLEKYGTCVGVAFQIQDDIMDIEKSMNKGRKIASDLRKGNRTLIIIKALKKCDKKQKKSILGVLGNVKANNKEIEKVIKIIDKTGAITNAKSYAQKKINEGKNHLRKADLNEQGNEFFNKFADYVIKRNK